MQIQRIGPIAGPAQHKLVRAYGAQKAFGLLGSNAVGAIPELDHMIRAYRTNDGTFAVFALANIGAPALPALCAALTNRQVQCRGAVAWSMASLGTNARPAMPLLLQCAQETNPQIVAGAVRTLGQLKGEPDTIIPVIIPKLTDPRIYVRMQAAMALGAFGPAGSNALPALRQALGDSNASVAVYARRAILNINSNALSRPTPP